MNKLSLMKVNRIKRGKVKVKLEVPLKRKPFKHQVKAYGIGVTLDSSAFLMEPGTGKTMAAIAVMGYRSLRNQVHRLLVIAPLSVVPEWVREFSEVAGFPYDIHVVTNKRFKFPPKKRKLQVVVITYDLARIMAGQLIRWRPDGVILDESQKVKNGTAKRSKTVHKLGDLAKYKLILTGTPVTQSPLDLWSQYRFLNPSVFGYRYKDFKRRYAVSIRTPAGWEKLKRYKNLEELSRKAHSIGYRVKKEEALDLPGSITQALYCTFDKQSQNIYNQMKKDAVIEFSHDEYIMAPLLVTQMIKEQQITGGFLKMDDGTIKEVSNSKLKALREILEDFPRDRKIVIFAKYIPELDAIRDMVLDLGMTVDTLRGKTRNRGDLLNRFQRMDEPQVLVVQLRAGGVGINLTRADSAIFYSQTFSYEDDEQARSRVYRSGQTRKVNFIYIIMKNTIDEEIMEAVIQKKSIADMVVDRINKIKGGTREMSKGTFVTENPEFVEKLESLKEAIEEGRKINLDVQPIPNPAKRDEPEDSTRAMEGVEITIIKGGKVQMTISPEKKEQQRKGKKEKVERTKIDGPIVTVKDLADELGMEPTELRKMLRDSDLQKPSGRWEWPENHKDLEIIKGWKK